MLQHLTNWNRPSSATSNVYYTPEMLEHLNAVAQYPASRHSGNRPAILKTLLVGAIPGVPESILSSVDEDLIVVQRAREEPSDLVGWEPSVMRVIRGRAAEDIRTWQDAYGDILNISIQPSRYLETDLRGAALTFTDQFFAPRSIKGWQKLSLHFARVCDAMAELMKLSGLKQRDVTHEDHGDSHLIYTNLVSMSGDALELARA